MNENCIDQSSIEDQKDDVDSKKTEDTRRKKPISIDSRVYLLISLLTIGMGIVFLILYARIPSVQATEKTIYLILASAILPAGLLWTIEHYFLQRPVEYQYISVLDQYRAERNQLLKEYDEDGQYILQQFRANQSRMEILQSADCYYFRGISDERAALVKRVLLDSLDDEGCKEIIIAGSTLDGLFRQGSWFEDFIRKALEKNKLLKLMFTHWDYVTHREKQEDRADGDIAQELKQSLVRAVTWKVPEGSIRLVHGAPTVFMVIAGNNMILNPYPFGRESVTSMAVWLTNPQPRTPQGPAGTIWHAYYINHYDMVWNPEKYPRKLSTVSEPISSKLPEGWEDEIETFIDGVRVASRKRATEFHRK
ncbi:MAG: hypothetical protein ABIK15_09585 [Pseudomonadota bacterium]